MTTQKQIEANQANALKSTGPKTDEGKAKSKMNAEKHGLLSQYSVMSGEDADRFEALRSMLRGEFKPEGGFEEILVDDLADRYWRLARTSRMENNILDLARCEIRHRIAKSKLTKAELDLLKMNDLIDPSQIPPSCKELKDKENATQEKVEFYEVTYGGAFLHSLKNGDPLSNLARHETRIRNEIQRLVRDLERRQQERRKGGPANARVGGNSIKESPAVPDSGSNQGAST